MESLATSQSTPAIEDLPELLGYHLNDALLRADDEGIIRGCNDAALLLLGYTQVELIGTYLHKLFPVKSPEAFSLQHATAGKPLFEDQPLRHPCDIRQKSGQSLPAQVIATRLRNPTSDEQLLLIIPEAVPDDEFIQSSRQEDTHASQMGMYVAQSGRFRFANRQFQRYLGFSEKELFAIPPARYIHPNDREAVRHTAVAMLKNRCSEGYEFRFATSDGEIRWAYESVTLITYQGKPGILGSFVDITERKESNAAPISQILN